MAEESNWEGILRIEIHSKYTSTDHFHYFLSGALEAIQHINTQIQEERILGQGVGNRKLISKYQPDVNGIVNTLSERTGIPHKIEFDNEKFQFTINEPTYHFDSLPLIGQLIKPYPPDMLALTFDVSRGINNQLGEAKEKLIHHRIQVQKELGKNPSDLAFKRLATTRQSFEHILDAITFVALCDKEKRENNRSHKSIAEEIDMPNSSAKSKYQTGTKIIISGQIRKYFPEFRLN